MSEVAGLKLSVSADLTDLLSGMKRAGKSLNHFQDQLKRFQSELGNATEPVGILRLNRAIDATQKKIRSISSAGLETSFKGIEKSAAGAAQSLGNGVVKGANTAGQSLVNLGRIAQDAPFGFIGIQNNINPLLESFQRLKVETGSASGAFKALGSSLLGGAGIGLAISIVTGLLTVLAQNGFFSAKKGADEAKKSTDEYASALKGIGDGLAKEATQVSVLVRALQSETLTRKEKIQALNELKQANPDYFSQLKIENGLIKGLEGAYRGYLNALKQRFATKALDLQLDKLFNRKLELDVFLDKSTFNNIDRETSQRITKIRAEIEKLGGIKILPQDVTQPLNDAQKQVSKLASLIQNLSSKNKIERIIDVNTGGELEKVNREINALLGRRTELDQLELNPINEKTINKVDKVSDTISNLYKELAAIKGQFDIGFLSVKDADIDRIQAYQKAFDELLKSGQNADGKMIMNLRAELNFTAPTARQDFAKEVKELADSLAIAAPEKSFKEALKPINIAIPVNPSLVLNEFENEAINLAAEINAILATTMENSFASIADGVADIITGGSIGDAFKGLLTAVGDGIIQLGKALVAAGIAKTALEKFGAAPGPQTILAGIGVQILGQVLKKSLPKFAEGGIVTGPMQAIVGEAGPEAIIPLSKLDRIIAGGGSQQLSGEFVVRGNDLVLALQRAQQSKNRLG